MYLSLIFVIYVGLTAATDPGSGLGKTAAATGSGSGSGKTAATTDPGSGSGKTAATTGTGSGSVKTATATGPGSGSGKTAAATNTGSGSEKTVADGAKLPQTCKEYNNIVNIHKGNTTEPQLNGTYKFLLIYDNTYTPSTGGIHPCLQTSYTKNGGNIEAISEIYYLSDDETDTKRTDMAIIKETVSPKQAGEKIWKMNGTMTPLFGEDKEIATYKGDFNFFHNDGRLVAYSACSYNAEKDQYGLVFIVSYKVSGLEVTSDILKELDTKLQPVRTKIDQMVKRMYNKDQDKETKQLYYFPPQQCFTFDTERTED